MRAFSGWILGVIVAVTCSAHAAGSISGTQPVQDLPEPLAFDPAVVRGTLDNGIRYMIRRNGKPEDRVELRLVVNAGSILERDEQQGLAHVCEHMCFNGTRHFAKSELVDYLESIGMAFGPDLNAYTSFDETVYMLQVPTEDPEILGKAFQILADWAHEVSFEGEEIDKERGVVIEEWRGGRGANQRIRDQQLPFLAKDSRYADRLPIGKKEILDTFEHDTLRNYYRTWYRPDLQTVIAVGDLEPETLLDYITTYFGSIPPHADAPPRETFGIPDQPGCRVLVTGDEEATRTRASVIYLRAKDELKTRQDYRDGLRDGLFTSMFNQRLAELAKQPDPPFLGAGSSKGNMLREKGSFSLGVSVADGGTQRGLEAVLTETQRLKQHGFTAPELERARARRLRAMQVAYNERDTTKSSVFARSYVSDVTEDSVSPGVEEELRLHKEMLDTVALEELNGLVSDWITDSNCVVMVSGPEKEDVPLPTEAELTAIVRATAAAEMEPYQDDAGSGPLLPEPPETPGSVVKKTVIDELGVHEWTLSNGIRMHLKPTDFKKDEIVLTAFSPGGHSLIDQDDFIPASSADGVVTEGGAGTFSLMQLRKHLAGKVAYASPYINELEEGIQAGCSPEDLETMFQLLVLRFQRPRADEEAFSAYQDRQRAALENRLANPSAVFSDEVTRIMSRGHPRRTPWTPETVDEMDLAESMEIYRDRFADADDFTFVLVGNLDLDRVEDLAGRYLATLPTREGSEQWIDREVRRPEGAVEKTLHQGVDNKAQVVAMSWGPFEWDYANRFELQAMMSALRIRMREVLREDLGGTYGVGVYARTDHIPEERYILNVAFGCSPDRIETMLEAVRTEIAAIQAEPLGELYVTKVKEGLLRKRETALKENGFWLSHLKSSAWHGEDPRIVLAFEDYVDRITAETIQTTAKEYFATENTGLFIHLPETDGDE